MDDYSAAVLTAQPALQSQLLFRVLVNDIWVGSSQITTGASVRVPTIQESREKVQKERG